MKDIRFSVLIPTYNRAVLLTKVVESILAQTYPAQEIIVVDDGSTDNTRELLDPYTRKTMNGRTEVRYFYQKNAGQSVALNNGLANASGDWIAFSANDDMWKPEKLEWQARAIQRSGSECGACFTDAQYVNNPRFNKRAFQVRQKIELNLERPTDDIGILKNAVDILVQHPHGVEVQTLTVREEIARRLGGFDPRMHLTEDFDFLFRLSFCTTFCFVNRPLVDIDRNVNRSDGLTELVWRKRQYALEQFEYTYKKWLEEPFHLTKNAKRSIMQSLRDIQNELASIYLVDGFFERAATKLSDTLQLSVSPKILVKYIAARIAPGAAGAFLRKRRPNQSVATLKDRTTASIPLT